jgi:hypothetical protein
MKKNIIISLFVWTMTALLIGCGGGGSGSSDSSSDGGGGSNPIPVNSAPIANAGINQTVAVGETVSLDGTGSADPDGDLLSFQWTIQSYPNGSTAAILNADKPNPLFTPDQPGDYVFQLVVTDSLGLSSAPATVTISTINSAPVADAGPDQSVSLIGTTVTLGGQSFDPDDDLIVYSWSIVTKPSGSSATLSDPASPDPKFVVDVQGDYVIELVVSDPWASSLPDAMIVSFGNLKPVAVAGNSFTLVLGNPASLDGSGSSDPNGDPLTYKWSFVYKPANSTAELNAPLTVNPTFLPDLAGTYVVSLIVNDGQVDSDPSTLSIMVVSSADPIIEDLIKAINAINALDSSAFKNRNLRKALINKINTAIAYIEQGLYSQAKSLFEGIIKRMDGCAKKGVPDKNDWIVTCDAQNQVYPIILSAIDELAKK